LAYTKRLTPLALVLVLILSAPVLAHEEQAPDVTGDWSVMFDGPQGMVRMETIFAQDDEELTGTVSGPMGSGVELIGKIEGSSIAFEFRINMAEISIRMSFTGEVSKDEENGSMTIAGMMDGQMMDSDTVNFSRPFMAQRKDG
tara:strand:- start:4071 stop:4499 length:429 start_codon:yes stop_codon:yes gene_type:complete